MQLSFAKFMAFSYKRSMLESAAANYEYREVTDNVEITVTPSYILERSAPENDYYFFAYNVTIRNLGDEPLKLINRHWNIRDGQKRERYVNGEGVVGQRPLIEAEGEFNYQSFCPLSTPTGNMRGKFEFEDPTGHRFWIPIPLFFFRTPDSFLQ